MTKATSDMKNKNLVAVLAMAVCFTALAQGPWSVPSVREYIWPDGAMPDAQSHQVGATTAEQKAPGYKADDFRRPYLDWFDPPAAEVRTDACMILISGGGYKSGYTFLQSLNLIQPY